jgi:putative two-component system response regulator
MRAGPCALEFAVATVWENNEMKQKARILVVDDEDRNLQLMRDILLLQEDYEVVLASDGVEALEKVRENPPDVILLDVNMPRKDGFEVASELKSKEETKLIPIVMVTGLSAVEHRIKALEVGADDFLAKPVDMMEVVARVRSLVKVKAYHDHMRDYQRALEAEVAKRTEQLQRAFDKVKVVSLDTIYRLSRAAEYKDEDTGAHLQRMSHYAAAVARRMSLNDRTVEAVLYASPMHDVGKIGIPDRILLKPGRLDEEEWETMKQHTAIGSRILEGSIGGFIKLAEVIALTHHEKWDGTGYPRGLKGSKIPLVGRISAIADVFDALNSKRPYKDAYPVEESFRMIREGRGSHFDPDVVDAFFAIREEILAIKEHYRDDGTSLLVLMATKSA